MSATFICKNCEQQRELNLRLKSTQQYCSDSTCQRARKRAWQKEKMATDAQYREKHRAAQRRWCKQKPLDRYQAQYRQRHPKYVAKNRERQKIRNAKRRQLVATASIPVEPIVKMDALSKIKSGTYLLTPYTMNASPTKIVKMDACVVQLQRLHQDDRQLLAQGL